MLNISSVVFANKSNAYPNKPILYPSITSSGKYLGPIVFNAKSFILYEDVYF